MLKKQGPIIEQFKPRSKVHHNHTYVRLSLINELPISVLRCTVTQIHRNKVKLHNYGDFRPVNLPQTKIDSFPMELEKSQAALTDTIDGLQNGNTIAVSDGSLSTS